MTCTIRRTKHPVGKKYSVHGAVQDYIKGECAPEKIVLGIPAYGRSFEGTSGLYGNFTKPTRGSYKGEPGMWDYKAMPLAGSTESTYDEKLGAAYSYDAASKIFITYKSPKSLAAKLDYIKKYNLGGTMYWSGDADAKAGSARSLITQSFNSFGRDNMAFWENNINYPDSKYSNVREGSSPATTKPVTTKPTTSKATPKPTPTSSNVTPSPKPTTTKGTPSPTPTKPTPVPPVTTSAPTTTPSSDKCDGNHKVCFWPLTHQVLPYGEADCKLFPSFVWCP